MSALFDATLRTMRQPMPSHLREVTPHPACAWFEGAFTPTLEARALSCVSAFGGATVPVLARIANDVLRSTLALRLLLLNGTDLDIVVARRHTAARYDCDDTFLLLDPQARVAAVRYRMTPWKRLRDDPATAFDWWAQLAAAGDPIDDAFAAWPETRPLVRLGRVELAPASVDHAETFCPHRLPCGIECVKAAAPSESTEAALTRSHP